MLRIGMVSALWGPAYPTGSGVYAFELANRLAERGCSVKIITTDVGHHNGFKYHKNISMDVLKTRNMAWDMNPVVNVAPYLSNLDLDVAHIHSYIYFLSNAMTFISRLKNVGSILHFHGGLSHTAFNNGTNKRIWMKNNIYDPTVGRFTASCADKVFSVSRRDIPVIEEKFGVAPDYITNAVSTELFQYDRGNEEKIVTYIGKLEPWKGSEYILPTFEKIHAKDKNIQFRIVGTGSESHLFNDTHLPIEVLGHVPHTLMPRIYQESSVTILPSLMEGTPTTCMEALACGTPVVATDVGDTSEIIQDSVNGYLCQVGDVNLMVNRVLDLVHDDDKRIEFGLRGRKRMEETFSYDVVIERLLPHYAELAMRRGKNNAGS